MFSSNPSVSSFDDSSNPSVFSFDDSSNLSVFSFDDNLKKDGVKIKSWRTKLWNHFLKMKQFGCMVFIKTTNQ